MSDSQGNPLARLLPTRAADRLSWIGAALVLLITQIVYTQTMTITSPFWDSGEFIATSYILGIPHPRAPRSMC